MRVSDVRDLSDSDVTKELERSQRELMNLRFRLATKQLANTSEMGRIKKTIARLQTVIKERELQGDGR